MRPRVSPVNTVGTPVTKFTSWIQASKGPKEQNDAPTTNEMGDILPWRFRDCFPVGFGPAPSEGRGSGSAEKRSGAPRRAGVHGDGQDGQHQHLSRCHWNGYSRLHG